MPANCIIENLYVGDIDDAHRVYMHRQADVIINVLESPDPDEHTPDEIWMPFAREKMAPHHGENKMIADHDKLDAIADLIDANLRKGKRILIHCGMGAERSPLAVMWFLKTKRGMTLDSAYAFVKRQRPITMYSLDWL